MALHKFLKRSLDKSDDNDDIVYKCCLKSLRMGSESELRDIELKSDGIPQYLGRTSETCIQDLFCSKKQIMLVPNLKAATITLEVCGINPSGLNGKAIEQNNKYEIRHGDVIEILHKNFPYKVIFDPEPNYDKQKENEQIQKKIKRNENKSDELDTKNGDISSDTDVNIMNFTWESINNGDLIICTSNGVKSSDKIAAYDMDGTLIKTKTGHVYPKDLTDWTIIYPNEILKKLKTLYDNGFKIVIFTNQAPIGKGKVPLDDFKVKIENIIKQLKIPVQVFIATRINLYRKPCIGMWDYMKNHKNDNKIIRKDESFFVGDAAGRPALTGIKRKKDHSCVDRLFALNIDIKFFTPEEHFLNCKEKVNYMLPKYNPKEQKLLNGNDNNVIKTICSNYNIPPDPDVCEMILMVGLPGSGKSYFVKNILEPCGYKVINRDTLGSIDKCIKLCEDNLSKNNKCVIDNTNVDMESRKRFINIAKKYSIQCRCFLMNLSLEHIKHNLTFRELIDENHLKVKELVLYTLKKKYVEPKLKEGFKEIHKIDVVPSKFQNDFHEKLYTMYLAEK